jgi:hypothetical protein
MCACAQRRALIIRIRVMSTKVRLRPACACAQRRALEQNSSRGGQVGGVFAGTSYRPAHLQPSLACA